MCGIVAGVSTNAISSELLKGLHYLEYRGYDSAGLTVAQSKGDLATYKTVGKVAALEATVPRSHRACSGIAHTRWATHGIVSEINAHPHVSHNRIAIVHNGIIENFTALRARLEEQGYQHQSSTDSEVIAHLIHSHLANKHHFFQAFCQAISDLKGSFAIAAIDSMQPDVIYAVTKDSPLVIGLGEKSHYIASDQIALLEQTNRFIYLEHGDIAILRADAVEIYDATYQRKNPPVITTDIPVNTRALQGHKHYMHQEIHYQLPMVEKLVTRPLYTDANLCVLLGAVKQIKMIACGTSHNAAQVAQYWLETYAHIDTSVHIASEYRYRTNIHHANTLCIFISQSGETADTLAAMRAASGQLACIGMGNELHSTMAREADYFLPIEAGKEIGVASTKAFTAQLLTLLRLTLSIANIQQPGQAIVQEIQAALPSLPSAIKTVLAQESYIAEVARKLTNVDNILFLGRHTHYAIAQEGALKLKELSYINANAYAAGELKHGPLALVDQTIQVIYLLPHNFLLEKNLSNLEEIEARGGNIIAIVDQEAAERLKDGVERLIIEKHHSVLSPIIHNIPLQLLAYYVALYKGHDVDQPRNLAKSVTVE